MEVLLLVFPLQPIFSTTAPPPSLSLLLNSVFHHEAVDYKGEAVWYAVVIFYSTDSLFLGHSLDFPLWKHHSLLLASMTEKG